MTEEQKATESATETPSAEQTQDAQSQKGAEKTEDKTEGKTLLTEDKPEGDKTEGEGETPLTKAPEEYEPFKGPNDVELDQETLGEFTTLAKELDLSQEQAQSLVDLQAKYFERMQGVQDQEHKALIQSWREQVERDPEIGGAKLKETQSAAQRALQRFGDKELKALLDESGLGNHPSLVKALARIGKLTDEDRLVEGSPPGKSKPGNLAEALYGKK